MVKEFLRSNFIVLCLCTSIIFLYPVLFFPKGELELLINQFHNPSLDIFFKYITNLGDGSLFAVLLIGLLFHNYYSSMLTALTIIFQAILVSIFKRGIYKGLERPLAFFNEDVSLNFVEGVDVHSFNTFPSGHTATAFAIFALLFIVIKNKSVIVSTILFMIAFLVGLSRIYLLQHFVVDAYFGAIFGILSVLIPMYFLEMMFTSGRLKSFENSSLRTTIKKK